MQCEMCGQTGPTRRVLVDRTAMNVCPKCARFGTVTAAARPEYAGLAPNVAEGLARRERRMGSGRDVFESQAMAQELVEDFGARIRRAREKRRWTRQELGARVKEPETAVTHYEAGTLHPPDAVAKRLERELGIVLFERVPTAAAPPSGDARGGLTLGDVLRSAQRRKDE